jgi:hypothetical protein
LAAALGDVEVVIADARPAELLGGHAEAARQLVDREAWIRTEEPVE